MPGGPASDPTSPSRFPGKRQLSWCISVQGLGRARSCKAAGRKGGYAEPEGCLYQLCHFGKNSFSTFAENLSFLNLHTELLAIALLITRSCYCCDKCVQNHKASPYCSSSMLHPELPPNSKCTLSSAALQTGGAAYALLPVAQQPNPLCLRSQHLQVQKMWIRKHGSNPCTVKLKPFAKQYGLLYCPRPICISSL